MFDDQDELLDKGHERSSSGRQGVRGRLCEAAEAGDVDSLRDLLRDGGWDADQYTPALDAAADIAAHRGHTEIQRVLYGHGAKLQPELLITAATHGHLQCVRYFIEEDARIDANVVGKAGRTALHQACSKNREQVCKYLMDTAGADPAAEASPHGMKAIHMAARAGHCAVLRILLSSACSPVDVDQRSSSEGEGSGSTPLHMACQGGQGEAVALLVDAGAQVNVTDRYGMRPVHHLARYTDSVSTLSYLIASGQPALLGPFPDNDGSNGEVPNAALSALEIAAMYGRQNLVNHLQHLMPAASASTRVDEETVGML